MKPTMAISVSVLAAGLALAQNPSVVQNTRATMNGVRDNSAAASNAALGGRYTPAASNTASTGGTQSATGAHSFHAKKRGRTAPFEAKRSHAPKVEPVAPNPMAQKRIGEIVGHPAPTAADGTS